MRAWIDILVTHLMVEFSMAAISSFHTPAQVFSERLRHFRGQVLFDADAEARVGGRCEVAKSLTFDYRKILC